MGIAGSWRHFWAQRSRSRLILGVVCVAAALIAVGFIYIPAAWLAQAGAALQAAGTYLLSFGGRAWLFAAGGALVVCALLLVVLPRRRPHPYWVRRPSGLPAVAVYLDLENQLSNTELRPFIQLLRKRLGGRRADLYYFADASRQAAGKMYQEIWRFGFRPVDVPHKHLGVQTVKNIVDVELSLFAYERALLGPPHQDIILVAADQDYLPLIYRLSALGHHVAIWGRAVPESYKSLQTYLDVEVFEFGTVVAQINPPPVPASEQKPTARRGNRSQPVKSPAIGGTTAQPGSLLGAIQATSELASQMAARQVSAERRAMDFKSQLGTLAPRYLKPIGYDGNSRSICWIESLCALGVLTEPAQHAAPQRGSADAVMAAQTLEAFLRDVAQVALTLAAQTPDSVIRFVELSRGLSQREAASLPSGHAPLLMLVSPTHRHHIAHTRYFCLCARALGLLRLTEVVQGTSIRLSDANVPIQMTGPSSESRQPEGSEAPAATD